MRYWGGKRFYNLVEAAAVRDPGSMCVFIFVYSFELNILSFTVFD